MFRQEEEVSDNKLIHLLEKAGLVEWDSEMDLYKQARLAIDSCSHPIADLEVPPHIDGEAVAVRDIIHGLAGFENYDIPVISAEPEKCMDASS